MRLLPFIVLLFLLGCKSVPPPRAEGEIAIRPGRPLKVWRTGGGFAPEVKVVYISPDRQEKVLFDGLDFPVKPREQRSESVSFGEWQVSYSVAAKSDAFGQEHVMEYTVKVRCGGYASERTKRLEYHPAYAPPYENTVLVAESPEDEMEYSPGEIKWKARLLPGSGGRLLEITGEVVSGAGITEVAAVRSGRAIRLRVTRGSGPESGVRQFSHTVSWVDGCELIEEESGEKIFPLEQ